MSSTIGILHPGAMGASVGACLVEAGHDVRWARIARSRETHQRAGLAGLTPCADLAALCAECDFIISVCPPHAALACAEDVAQLGFSGVFVDANAVSPQTTRAVAQMVAGGGSAFVDGAIIGPPVVHPDSTRLYVSGVESQKVAALFRGSKLQTRILGDDEHAASALKMCYAAWTKGSSALLLAVAALAHTHKVEAALRAEWAISIPELDDKLVSTAQRDAPKAWRFAGEMQEIANTFAAADLPPGFHRAAAELFTALQAFRGSERAPTVDAVIEALVGQKR